MQVRVTSSYGLIRLFRTAGWLLAGVDFGFQQRAVNGGRCKSVVCKRWTTLDNGNTRVKFSFDSGLTPMFDLCRWTIFIGAVAPDISDVRYLRAPYSGFFSTRRGKDYTRLLTSSGWHPFVMQIWGSQRDVRALDAHQYPYTACINFRPQKLFMKFIHKKPLA